MNLILTSIIKEESPKYLNIPALFLGSKETKKLSRLIKTAFFKTNYPNVCHTMCVIGIDNSDHRLLDTLWARVLWFLSFVSFVNFVDLTHKAHKTHKLTKLR